MAGSQKYGQKINDSGISRNSQVKYQKEFNLNIDIAVILYML